MKHKAFRTRSLTQSEPARAFHQRLLMPIGAAGIIKEAVREPDHQERVDSSVGI
jgi:hypothetical protein